MSTTTDTIYDYGHSPLTIEAIAIETGVFDMPGSEPGAPYVDFPAIEITTENVNAIRRDPSNVDRITLDPEQAFRLAHRLLRLTCPLLDDATMIAIANEEHNDDPEDTR